MSRNSDNSFNNDNYNLAQNSSELFDLYPSPPSPSHYNSVITPQWGTAYFPSPRPTGEVKQRGRIHIDGDWHRSVHAWIAQRGRDTIAQGDEPAVTVLLQRRSPYKDTHPNQLDVSCAGHVNAGDEILDTMMRELNEELGAGTGFGVMEQFSLDDVQQSRSFTVTSAIEGETERYGKFTCREYQDVFILWWKGDSPMETKMFQPLVEEEVSGFELLDGKELIERLRRGDRELVPRSTEYIDALKRVLLEYDN